MSEEPVDRVFLFTFFLRSVVFTAPAALIYLIRLQILKRKFYEMLALQKLQTEYRLPSKFLVFTKENAQIFTERDGANDAGFVEIGNIETDEFFSDAVPKNSGDYYLLIDEPWSEIKEYASPGFGISKEQTNEFYKKLSDFAKTHSMKLKIKLHPYSYKSDFFVNDANIEYIRDADTKKLILNSRAVFGFSSTLLLPAVFYKKCCVFNLWENMTFQRDLKDLGIVQVLEYHNFTVNDIDFESIDKTPEKLRRFVSKYLYAADGGSIERLKNALLS